MKYCDQDLRGAIQAGTEKEILRENIIIHNGKQGTN